jgi:hypothetical protein
MIQKDCPTGLSNFNVVKRVTMVFLQHSDHADSVCGQAASLPRAWAEVTPIMEVVPADSMPE